MEPSSFCIATPLVKTEWTDFIVEWHQQLYAPIEGTHFYMTGATPLYFSASAHTHIVA